MISACDAWEELEQTRPLEAQYAVPLGFRIRTLWTLNLRELFHVVELRSARQGHASYRRIAQGLYRAAIADVRRAKSGQPLQGGYPDVHDGLRGIRFLVKTVESAKKGAAWVDL